jgi:Beta-eliminating lyase
LKKLVRLLVEVCEAREEHVAEAEARRKTESAAAVALAWTFWDCGRITGHSEKALRGCSCKSLAWTMDPAIRPSLKMTTLSKALGAPAGSLLTGPAEAMARGRLYRKRLGGGMRQAGVLAAAALIALEQILKCLSVDHANATFLAEGLAALPGIALDPAKVMTNIVIFDVSGAGLTSTEISAR